MGMEVGGRQQTGGPVRRQYPKKGPVRRNAKKTGTFGGLWFSIEKPAFMP